MSETPPLVKKLLMLGAYYVIVASGLVIYFKAPLRPVLVGGILVLILTLAQHFTAKRQP